MVPALIATPPTVALIVVLVAARATVKFKVAVLTYAGELESVTETTTEIVDVDALVGVPEISPEFDILRPAGRVPLVMA